MSSRSRSPSSRRSAGRTLIVALVAIVGYVGVVWLVRGDDTRPGELHSVIDPHLGDPFEIDWTALEGSDQGPSSYQRPLPMASLDPPCVGFGRLDWAEADRQPSVAYCSDPETATQLPGNGLTVVKSRLSGGDTWHLILFGDEIRQVEVQLDDPRSLPPERVFVGGRYAGFLLPNGHGHPTVVWRVDAGTRYECTFADGIEFSVECA